MRDGDVSLTYAELLARVSSVGSRLVQALTSDAGEELGVSGSAGEVETPVVCLCLDRGVDVIVGMLAAHWAGAAYTVVEPNDESSAWVDEAQQDGIAIVVAEPQRRARLSGAVSTVMALPRWDGSSNGALSGPRKVSGQQIAYVVYTSGSTGARKGVCVTHDNVLHYANGLLSYLGVEGPLSYAHVTTLAADLGNTCIFLALLTGGSLHVVDEATRRDPAALLNYLGEYQVDVLKTTPSHFRIILEAHRISLSPPRLQLLILGGERLTRDLAVTVLASGVTSALVNHYGPSETTVGVCAHVLTSKDDLDALRDHESVPIGRPFGDSVALIELDDGEVVGADSGRPVTGQLLIAGPSVTLGYLNSPEMTAAVFAPAYSGGPVAYRTGDQVRVDENGLIEFLGRRDRQVKVRGYRVDLGDVETRLRRRPGVAEALAFLTRGDFPSLVAAVLVEGTSFTGRTLREEMLASCPAQIVPDRISIYTTLPTTQNGKIDVEALRHDFTAIKSDVAEERISATPGTTLGLVVSAWREALGHDQFGVDDDFNTIGGTSIGAIQVVAAYQRMGYSVSASDVFARPTLHAQAELLARRTQPADEAGPQADRPHVPDALLPAQSWFFEANLADPDHWNQAVVLDLPARPDLEALKQAVKDVVQTHPMLRTAFRRNGGAAVHYPTDRLPMLTTSEIPPTADAQSHMREAALAAQSRISVESGDLVAAHLVLGEAQAHLLLVAHHLAVDAVSWRLIISELGRRYGLRRRGVASAVRVQSGANEFATQLRHLAGRLLVDLEHWGELGKTGFAVDPDNTEGNVGVLWFALTPAETAALDDWAADSGVSSHALLLAVVGMTLAEQQVVAPRFTVDIESHGRHPLPDLVDVSSVVGWFTTTFPIEVDTDLPLPQAAVAIDRSIGAVPHQGIAFELHGEARSADVCFNYLGPMTLPLDDLNSSWSVLSTGPLRGRENLRRHRWTITARRHDDGLIVDVAYPRAYTSPSVVCGIPEGITTALLRTIGQPDRVPDVIAETESSSGQLARVPRGLLGVPTGDPRQYGTVVLTGATGFIGSHVLAELMSETDWDVRCVVRASGTKDARERLENTYHAYHGESLASFGHRIKVVTGDVTQVRFGLNEAEWSDLAHHTSAVFHLAADTRLAGSHATFRENNLASLDAVLMLATAGRSKDVHFASTLAIAGEGPSSGWAVFSEDSLDIGQRFLNEYEHTKFIAEQTLNEFAAGGGSVFVYRAGNVSTHSQTGRFQHNAQDNRLIQILRGCLMLRRVPDLADHEVVLSPVDVVARSLVGIACCGRVQGGTFHLESPHAIRYGALFDALRRRGAALEVDRAPGFRELFEAAGDPANPVLAVAQFWARRPERRVTIASERSTALITQLGIDYPQPDGPWLDHLAEAVLEVSTSEQRSSS